MNDTYHTLKNRPILWQDKQDSIHACEGSDLKLPGLDSRLIWTLCERDVPANTAFLAGDGDKVTCATCAARSKEVSP